jgi:hypothetical protein
VIEFTPLAFSSPRKLFKRKVKVSFVFVFFFCLKVAEQIALDSQSNVIRHEVLRRIEKGSPGIFAYRIGKYTYL